MTRSQVSEIIWVSLGSLPLPAAPPRRQGLSSFGAGSRSHLVLGPLSWKVIQPANYWKLKPGNLSPSAGRLTTNHLLANPEQDLVTPSAPAWLHYHGPGKEGNLEVTGAFG